ncbi:mitochondrial protein Pet127-domain-containing protein [Nemania diffusa]|nr:mitochondrial protein Pet127-domain-containing protein [Nemania diffusa]
MLRLGRHGLCRLSSSYICASCLATSHSSSIISRRRAVASQHARPFSTTIACRETAAPGAEAAAPGAENTTPAEIIAEKVVPLPPKKSKKKKPSQQSSAAPPSSPKKQPETDAQRQLKVLQGALSALQNVLTTQGVDVSQIPAMMKLTAATSSTEPTVKAKSKPKPKKKGDKSPKSPKTTAAPDTSSENVKTTVTPDASSESVESEAFMRSAVLGHPKKSAKADRASAKTRPRSILKATTRPGKPSKSRRGSSTPTKQSKQSEEQPGVAKPANLGVPFGTGIKIAGKRSSSANLAVALDKLPDKFHPGQLSMVPINTVRPDVPSLSYGLERVLFNPGVYQLQDPRSRVYNFDPYLSEIMPVDEFDFNALKEYVTSSKDSTLISIAKEYQKKYTGSTSSMTSMLAHFHYLLSAWREINTSMLSRSFVPESSQYTRILRAPAAIFLHWKNGTYAIDADKEFDTANILSMLGKSMEKLLTLSKDDYERYRHGNSDQITEEERNAEEAFHYTGFQDFMMRSQLDAHDERVPGTGMFDLKTRAVISIRMDAKGYHKGLGYEIRNSLGQWESFEREYHDMIRSAFLKYSLQVRMGRMDGIFVAFHNTQRIFGFQYIPLTDMDTALHGPENQLVGDQEFKASLKLLNELLNRATQKWPEQSLRLHFETRTSTTAPFMYFFAEPTTPEDIAAVQNAGRASIEAFEKDILGLVRDAEDDVEQSATLIDDTNGQDFDQVVPVPAQEIDSLTAWQEARQMVEEAMGDDEEGVGVVREAIADALEQSGILRARSLAESREYVNALLEALTGRTLSAQADAAAVYPKEEETIDEDELEEQTTHPTQEELDQSFQPTLSHSDDNAATLNSALDQEIETENPEHVCSNQDNAEGSPPGTDGRDGHTDSPEPEASSISSRSSPHLDQPIGDNHEVQSPSSQTISNGDMEEAASTTTLGTVDQAREPELDASKQKDLEEGFEEDDDYEEASETEIEAKEANEDVAATSLEPLKSLIMRMARRVDERPVPGMDTDRPQDDASKLQAFERILGRLISQSKTEQPQRASSDDKLDQDSSSGSTPLGAGSAEVKSESEVPFPPDTQTEGTPQPDGVEQPKTDQETQKPELLAFSLTIKNKVNGAYVDRPNRLKKDDDWQVEYEIEEVKEPRARKIYEQLKERRRKVLYDTGDKEAEWHKMFQGNLKALTQKGREFREQETRRAEGQPVYILGIDGPLQWADVFRKQTKNLQASDEESSDSQK